METVPLSIWGPLYILFFAGFDDRKVSKPLKQWDEIYLLCMYLYVSVYQSFRTQCMSDIKEPEVAMGSKDMPLLSG